MVKHHKIDYVELPAVDIAATEAFFQEVFGWAFTHWGEEYIDSSGGGIALGFYHASLESRTESGGALVTLYSHNLEQTMAAVTAHGGTISKEIFSFPGGRRFQFLEPSGNEFGVWSDQEPCEGE